MDDTANAYERLLRHADRRRHARGDVDLTPAQATRQTDKAAEVYKVILEGFRQSEPDNPLIALRS
jgi:hypothetical protein